MDRTPGSRIGRGLALLASVLVATALAGPGPGAAATIAGSDPEDTEPGTITTVAGGLGDNKPATQASVGYPTGLAVDSAGNLYVAQGNQGEHRIRKIDVSGRVSTVAGNGVQGWTGDGGPATDAQLRSPRGVTVDAAGNLFIADQGNHRVRKVATDGTITTVAGGALVTAAATITGNPHLARTGAYCGDGGPAVAACLNFPSQVAVDAAGNLFIADSGNQRVRKVDAVTGIITLVAGGGREGLCGQDGAPAVLACLSFPAGLAFDAAGNLYIADSGNQRVRKVDAVTGIITLVAGTGQADYCGDGGPATSACLNGPQQIAFDAAGNLYIADSGNERVRKVDAVTGIITTVAGTGIQAPLSGPDFGNQDVGQHGGVGDGGPATEAPLVLPYGVAVGPGGNLYLSEAQHRVRRVHATTGIITTVAGTGWRSYSGDGGPATDADLDAVAGVTASRTGDVYIVDSRNHRVRKVDPAGIITTVAGTGLPGFAGDGGPATQARLTGPRDVDVDAAGNLFIADSYNCRIRRVDAATGVITTVAGRGVYNPAADLLRESEYSGCGYAGDGGPATAARLNFPGGVAVDAAGNLFIADTITCRVRKVDAATGIISTVAGIGIPSKLPGTCGYDGDGGPATQAKISAPRGVAVDPAGNLFIADSGFEASANDPLDSHRIRKVDAATGIISTVAGNGRVGYAGDGGPATQARLRWPTQVTVDPAGNLFIADTYNSRIRKVDAATGIISTVAGGGQPNPCHPLGLDTSNLDGERENTHCAANYSGDGGPATEATLAEAKGVAVTARGDLLIADSGLGWGWQYFPRGTSRIRLVTGVAAPAA